MAPSLNITHISTAAAILEIDGINFLTDPFFSPAGSEWDRGNIVLRNDTTPALALADLPVIDAVLLSHEDHPDNLDELGRQLLDGRRVLTTVDGANKLAPRSGVRSLKPWQTVSLDIGDKHFDVTGTPCVHVPGGEVTGFILTAATFGQTDGLPNAIYFSGDTVYVDELAQIGDRFHVSAAIFNIGAATIEVNGEPLLLTMNGKQAARLFRKIKADVLVPMHYEHWNHFRENGEALAKVFEEEGILDKVRWLDAGVSKKIL